MGKCLRCEHTFECVLYAEAICNGDMSKLNDKQIKRVCKLGGGFKESKHDSNKRYENAKELC